MGLRPRTPSEDPGGESQPYVSTVTAEEMAAMAAEYADGYPSDEDMYEEPGAASKGQPKPNLASKLSSAVKNFSLPSPEEIMNSNFVKSFQQPLMVKSKIQNPKTLQAYQATIAENSPATLSKINKLSDFPVPTLKRREKEEPKEPKEECNGAEEPHEDFGYGTLRSLRETKLVTNIRESDIDDEKTLRRMEITKTMTPAQLAEIKSLKDIPVPGVFKQFSREKTSKPKASSNGEAAKAAEDGEEEAGEKKSFFGEGFMDQKLLTNSKENDPEDEKIIKRQELVRSKTPSELAAIHGFSDLPIPSKIENLIKGGATTPSMSLSSLKEGGFSVPEVFKMELAVGAQIEDPEIMERNRNLVNTKSVAELSQIHSLSEFPVPTIIENLCKKKDDGGEESESVINRSNLSLSGITSGKLIPESLRETKLVTNIKEEKDMEKLAARQNLIKSKTPMELSQIKDWSEFPIPSKLQHLQIPSLKVGGSKNNLANSEVNDSPPVPPRQKSCNNSIYESLPSSLRNEVIVRSRPIDEEEVLKRQEIIRSKTPTELSQINSLKDFPVPKTIEKLFEKGEDEGKEKKEESDYDFIEKYSTLPAAMKTNLLVGCKTEDQEVVQERLEVVKSKSVNELSEIKSMADIPIPSPLTSTLSRITKKDHYAPVERKKLFKMQMKSQSSQSINHQPGTLPRSVKEQNLLMTNSKIEDPDVLASRRSLVESKSVAELSKVSSLSDVPVPSFLSRLASASLNKLHSLSTGHLNETGGETDSKSVTGSGIYGAIPSLNTELLVGRSVQDINKVEERRAVISSKSVSELSQVRTLKDFPVPDAVQTIYAKSMERLSGAAHDSADGGSVSGGLTGIRLPSMLSQPCIVTTKIEDPQKLLERQQIQQQKSVHELSKIRNLNEFPVPGNLFTLPDVPLPKAKNLLNYIARPPRRKNTQPSPSLSERMPDSQLDSFSNFESSQIEEEDNYSHLEDSYEVIEKEEVMDSSHTEPADQFGLASQIKGTPERNTRSNKKKKPDPRNRRSHEDKGEEVMSTEPVETPPPLPPKRSPHKQMSVESQQSMEGSPAPVKGILTLEAMNGNVQVKNEVHVPEIQARPLPTPPAPIRYHRLKEQDRAERTLIEESANFQTCRDTMTTQSRTLMGTDDDDNTMADSIVDSLVSCTDTLICDDETEGDDDPYPSVNFESGMAELIEGRPAERRLEEGTQQLSQELMEHVDALRSTLDNMSNRLGARSRSRSSSRPRSGSRTRPSRGILQDKL